VTAYYNEHDPFAAAWLRELIADNLIAPGEVDERSIEDVTPDDLRPFQQCHFFAGIGIWSLAARRAGIPDDAPLWSGSCPCQPFSAAGKGGGFADERHLWPSFHYLIEQCEPALIVGEQVAGADGDTWFDLVSADLDATAYAFGAAETVAAGFGAPHKRTRNYWVAYRLGARLEGFAGHGGDGHESGRFGTLAPRPTPEGGLPDGMADGAGRGLGKQWREVEPGHVRHANSGGDAPRDMADSVGDGRRAGRDPDTGHDGHQPDPSGECAPDRLADAAHGDGRRGKWGEEKGTWSAEQRGVGSSSRRDAGGVADTHGGLAGDGDAQRIGEQRFGASNGGVGRPGGGGAQPETARRMERPGPVNGLWRNADWLRCRDEKWRPVESGTFPLVDAGTFRNRVGLLRGAGNAISLGQAQGFLDAVIASVCTKS
jgi:DNA (cytosine-5)-methyltransferase 1